MGKCSKKHLIINNIKFENERKSHLELGSGSFVMLKQIQDDLRQGILPDSVGVSYHLLILFNKMRGQPGKDDADDWDKSTKLVAYS